MRAKTALLGFLGANVLANVASAQEKIPDSRLRSLARLARTFARFLVDLSAIDVGAVLPLHAQGQTVVVGASVAQQPALRKLAEIRWWRSHGFAFGYGNTQQTICSGRD
jgi:hypothetical protein